MPDFFDSPVVCNSGPILGLSRAGLCQLLTNIFPELLIPEAVALELRAKTTADAPDVGSVLASARVYKLSTPLDPLILAELDAGEASVIQTARETGFASVLIDERRALKVAAMIYDLKVRGTCALLLEAKRRQLIPLVAPALTSMVNGGYFIGPRVQAECLVQAGEQTS